ncbi:SMG9 protein [Phytophthora cinnamomi]|uniref:SMG9 protein n=1 Tax=Phytophthora cinnamomi TaxID=4785 RepID=UPI00355A48D5|nr:SMG9 protein [Phytophthora cinnamomi]
MDRESTPQKQRQKRSGSNRRNSSASAGHGAPSRASMGAAPGPGNGPARAFRGPQRPRSRTTAPAAIMSKPPSMLLRPPSGASSGVLYEPDAPQLQVNTRLSGSSVSRAPSPHTLRASSSPGPRRASTIQQTKIVPPSTSVKLITPQMQFATDLSMKLGNCLELTNFTVVGVMGLEGVGKSTVLSLLAEKDIGGQKETIFSTRSLEAVVMDHHETTGVDLAISMVGGSGHPTILLDSQPLLSSSMLADVLDRNESLRFGALTPEQQVEAASYQIAVFLCAICHYVVLVHDGLAFQVSAYDLLQENTDIHVRIRESAFDLISHVTHRASNVVIN